MKYKQKGGGVITDVIDEMDFEGAAGQNGAGEWPVSSGAGRTEPPKGIAGDLLHYLRRAGGDADLIANLKTLQANFNGEEVRWIQDFHEIVYDAWQMKELRQDVAIAFIDRATSLFGRQGAAEDW